MQILSVYIYVCVDIYMHTYTCYIYLYIHIYIHILLMGFPRQKYWSGLAFSFLVAHILSKPPTVTHPSWVALHDIAQSFIELDKALVHVISLISFLSN